MTHQTFSFKQKPTYQNMNDLADDISDNTVGHNHTEGAGGTGRKLTASGLEDAGSPEIRDYDMHPGFIVSGMLPVTSANLTSNISAGEGYAPYDGTSRLVRVVLASAQSHTYTASRDTYVYLHPYSEIHTTPDDGFFHFAEVANGAAEPAQPDSSIKIAKVVTNGSAITTVTDLRRTTPVGDGTVKGETLATNAITLGYGTQTSTQSGITTVTDLTGASATVTVPAGGRKVKITGYLASCGSSVSDDRALLSIKEGATVINGAYITSRGAGLSTQVTCIGVITPTAAEHTYKLTLERNTGTGTQTSEVGATFISFILVELI